MVRRETELQRYVPHQDVEMSVEHFVLFDEFRRFEKLRQRGECGGQNVQGSYQQGDEEDDEVRLRVVSDESEVNRSVNYGNDYHRNGEHVVERVVLCAGLMMHP